MSETEPDNIKSATKVTDEAVKNELDMMYLIDDKPPWYLCILLAFQHLFTMISSVIVLPFLLSGPMCFKDQPVVISELSSTMLFVSGIVTLLQTTFGCRLPIVQGGSFAFLAPTFSILGLEKWKCPSSNSRAVSGNSSFQNASYSNLDPDLWKSRMNEIQGAIMMASIVQAVIGFSGLLGILIKFIGPLTIAPTVAMIGLSLYVPAANYASGHWGVAALTCGLIIIFSQFLKNVEVPVGMYNRNTGWTKKDFKIFQLFPILMSILISWLVCYIITEVNGFPSGSKARTDYRAPALLNAPWFRFPYPGQWGSPTISAAGTIGMLAGTIASIVESIGDYYACARMSGAPPPPGHAINRGCFMEGLGCLLAGAWGTGNGTTSFSQNIGAIGITKVSSRLVIQVFGVIVIVLGVFIKFCALLTALPEPIVGGVILVVFGMIVSIGISNIQFVNLNSTRNIFILGFSLFMGVVIPYWFQNNDVIKTGVDEIDQIIKVLLTQNMFIAGFIGCFFDNTIPGSLAERGMGNLQDQQPIDDKTTDLCNGSIRQVYNLPFCLSRISTYKFAKYVPILPYYSESCYDSEL